MKFSSDMYCLTVVVGLTAICAINAIPLVPEDNSHYVDGESRYIWMTDDDGVSHLQDLQAPIDFEFLEENNGTGNQYWLFTRSNPTTGQLLINGDENSVTSSNYDSSKPLKVVVHGWGGSLASLVNREITSAFLAQFDVNVIVVDWRGLAGANYVIATAGVPIVGRSTSTFLRWLINTAGGNWNNVHLVGYSLGAHAVGVAGRIARIRLSRPARITGLDPANPLWNDNSYALSSGDGQYVEVIHTDIFVRGIAQPIGDADFYPNGGRNQPGCERNDHCNHRRAYELFASSVRTDHLVGKRCLTFIHALANNCNGRELNLGNGIISKRGSGIFGLETGDTWPF